MQELADMFKFEPCLCGFFTDSHPADVPLAHMPKSLGLVHKCMNLSLQHGFKINLHFSSCHFNHNAQGQLAAGVNRIDIWPHNVYLAVFNLTDIQHPKPFKRRCPLASKFTLHILLADSLTLKCRADRHRDRHLRDLYLQPSYFNSFFYYLVMRDVGYNVLVGAYTGRQNLGNVRISDGGESVINCAGGSGVPFVGNLPKSDNKCKDSVFVVEEVASVIARLDPTEGKGHSAGKTSGVYCCRNLPPKGYKPCIPAQIHTAFD